MKLIGYMVVGNGQHGLRNLQSESSRFIDITEDHGYFTHRGYTLLPVYANEEELTEINEEVAQ